MKRTMPAFSKILALADIRTPASPAAQLELESQMLLANLDRYALRNYGPRCPDFEPDCCVCKLYAARDVICEVIE